jgi:thiamine pyrophosphokinase
MSDPGLPAAIVPTAIVFTGSGAVPPAVRARLPGEAYVIAADSGLGVAGGLGVPVDLLIGDMDSVDAAAVEVAEAGGTTVERHPAEKDATDLELALDAALARGARHVVVIDGGGDRLDHLLGNLLLLASSDYAGVALEAFTSTAYVAVVRGGDPPLTIRGEPGSIVSLFSVGGPARGIATTSLRYPLRDEELPSGTSRGVSNELDAEEATVELKSGALLVVQPFGGAR